MPAVNIAAAIAGDGEERRLEGDRAADDPAERGAGDRPEAVGGEREADRLPLSPRAREVGDECERGDPAGGRAEPLDGAAGEQNAERVREGDQQGAATR